MRAALIKARIFIREDYEKTLFYPLKFVSGFQFYNLIQNLSVEENILLPIKMAGKKSRATRKNWKKYWRLQDLRPKEI